MALAEAIGDTCFEMYAHTKTGLSPEFVNFVAGQDMLTPRSACFNIGRPEAVETFFVLYYYTRDPKWRNMGWEVFKAFEKYAATPSGWTSLPDVENPGRKRFILHTSYFILHTSYFILHTVENPGRKRDDKMESFVLAETVK